jgi:hypothetical protein
LPKPNPAASVIDLDLDTNGDHDATAADAYALGEPFALATGAELLDTEGRIPGCIVSARCDCGAAFKFSLLAPGLKACPGCGTQYSHALLLAPADDLEIVDQFNEVIEGDDDEADDLAGIEADDDEADDEADDDQDDDQDDAADEPPPA